MRSNATLLVDRVPDAIGFAFVVEGGLGETAKFESSSLLCEIWIHFQVSLILGPFEVNGTRPLVQIIVAFNIVSSF